MQIMLNADVTFQKWGFSDSAGNIKNLTEDCVFNQSMETSLVQLAS